MPIVFRAYMGEAALDTERRSIAFREQGDWVQALSVWLDLAQRYPHEDAPLHAFVGHFTWCALALQAGLPRFTALPGRYPACKPPLKRGCSNRYKTI